MNFLKFILLILLFGKYSLILFGLSLKNSTNNQLITLSIEKNVTNDSDLIFKAKETETTDYDYEEGLNEYDYYLEEYEIQNTNESSSNNNKNLTSELNTDLMVKEPKLELIYAFVAHVLQKTTPNENTIELYNPRLKNNEPSQEPDYKLDNENSLYDE